MQKRILYLLYHIVGSGFLKTETLVKVSIEKKGRAIWLP
jgi:hypothetical protein